MPKAVDPHSFLEFYSRKILKIAIPVLITLFLDAYLTRFLEETSGTVQLDRSVSAAMSQNDANMSVSDSLILALIIIGMLVVVTGILLTLYYFGFVKIIFGWLILAVSALLSYYMWICFASVPSILNIPVDWITIAFIVFNLVVVGNMSIFWRAPPIVTQCFLIFISVMVALVFRSFPDWSVWILLGLLVIYDAVVVLCPNGLLKLLIEKSQERGDAIPALIYASAAFSWNESQSDSESQRSNSESSFDDEEEEEEEEEEHVEHVEHVEHSETPTEPPVEIQATSQEEPELTPLQDNNEQTQPPKEKKKKKQAEEEGVKLGLGDFVFYGILITRAARLGWDITILCVFAVILGLSLTLLCLAWLQRPLPALPFSLVLGIIFFIIGAFSFREYWQILRKNLIVF